MPDARRVSVEAAVTAAALALAAYQFAVLISIAATHRAALQHVVLADGRSLGLELLSIALDARQSGAGFRR
jgi:hypothetical protein